MIRWRQRAVFVGAVAILAVGCAHDPEERRGSIYEWKASPTPENVARIRNLLEDADRDVRATALNVLVTLDVEDSGDLALAGLKDEDGFVRATAAKLLGDLGRQDDATVLSERLTEDREPIVRQRAAEALTKLGGDVALAGLAEGTGDPVDNVRLAAVRGLRKLDPGFARALLVRLLFEDARWEIRVQAATALGRCRDPEVLPALEAALDDPNEFVRSAVANAMRHHESAAEDEAREVSGGEPS